jgi:hypothetical protein
VNGKFDHLSQSLDMQETVEDHSIASQEIPCDALLIGTDDWLIMETLMNFWVR